MTLLLVYLSVHAVGYGIALAMWARELSRHSRPEF